MLHRVHNFSHIVHMAIYVLFQNWSQIPKLASKYIGVNWTTIFRCVLAKAGKWKEISMDRPYQCHSRGEKLWHPSNGKCHKVRKHTKIKCFSKLYLRWSEAMEVRFWCLQLQVNAKFDFRRKQKISACKRKCNGKWCKICKCCPVSLLIEGSL